MDLQKSIIKRFKEVYPDLTYSQISQLTGIQQTRTFRIFNGFEMKISEYEIMKSLIEKKSYSNDVQEAFANFSKRIALSLREEKLKKFILKFQRELHMECLKGNLDDLVEKLSVTA